MDTDDTIDAENGRKLRELVRQVGAPARAGLSFPGSAWERTAVEAQPLGPRGGAVQPARSQAEPGNERRDRVRSRAEPGNELLDDGAAAPVLGYLMKGRCPTGADPGDDGAAGFVEVDQVKLFRNLPELRFEGRIHEQILLPIRRAGGTVAWTDIFVVHSGADQSPAGRARKLERDLRILELEHRERPDHPFALFNLGMTLAEAGRHDEAIGWLWQSIGRSGPDESHLRKAYALLAASYRALGRHETALETCRQGLERFPTDPELQFRHATLLHQFGRLPEAAQAYEALLSPRAERHLSSVNAGLTGFRARHNLAGVYAELGDLGRAEALWRQVIQDAPSFRPAWRALGNVLLREDKADDALLLAELMEQHVK